MAGVLYVVSTPIGHAEDITLRALRVLKAVAVVAAEDPQRTKALLDRHAIETPITSYHNENKETKAEILIDYLQDGRCVALVADAGTPVIADPGRYLIERALAARISVSPVPGPSAVLAAVTVSGLSGDSFLFAGMLPRSPRAVRRFLRPLSGETRSLVFLTESPFRPRMTLARLLEVLGDRHVILAKDLTTDQEECLRGPPSRLLATVGAGPWGGAVTIVVEGAGKGRNAGPTRKVKRRSVSGS